MTCVSALLLAGAAFAGCTAKSHENDPRPPVVPVVSVSVSKDAVQVAPRGVGIPGQVPVNINQNADSPINQADPAAPAVVNVRFSNLLRRRAPLVLEGPVDRVYPMPPASPGSFSIGLKPGIYRFSSPGSTGTARLFVGPSRVSSSGDLLTP